MKCNYIRPNGAISLVEGLKVNSSLTCLILSGCVNHKWWCWFSIEGNDIGPEGGEALGECLKVNSTLQQLHLDNHSFPTTLCVFMFLVQLEMKDWCIWVKDWRLIQQSILYHWPNELNWLIVSSLSLFYYWKFNKRWRD